MPGFVISSTPSTSGNVHRKNKKNYRVLVGTGKRQHISPRFSSVDGNVAPSLLRILEITTSVCVFSSHLFWTSMDVPAGVTQEEGHTGFLIHLLSAVHALIFLARRIQPFLSLVDREVEFCVLTILIVLHPLGIFIFVF